MERYAGWALVALIVGVMGWAGVKASEAYNAHRRNVSGAVTVASVPAGQLAALPNLSGLAVEPLEQGASQMVELVVERRAETPNACATRLAHDWEAGQLVSLDGEGAEYFVASDGAADIGGLFDPDGLYEAASFASIAYQCVTPACDITVTAAGYRVAFTMDMAIATRDGMGADSVDAVESPFPFTAIFLACDGDRLYPIASSRGLARQEGGLWRGDVAVEAPGADAMVVVPGHAKSTAAQHMAMAAVVECCFVLGPQLRPGQTTVRTYRGAIKNLAVESALR